MGQRLSLIMGVLYGINVDSFSKIFDYDGNGKSYLGVFLEEQNYALNL